MNLQTGHTPLETMAIGHVSAEDELSHDFPILRQLVYGRPLVYLDNAASTQKPQVVIDAISRFYSEDYANIHRGVHALSARATRAYELARAKVQRFINAGESREVVFVRGTTEGINLVANTYGLKNIHAGDEIVISALEHHSNIVPWQILCERTGATLRVAPINDRGEVLLDELEGLLGSRVKMVAVAHISNALGTVNPVEEIVRMAHARGIPVLVDGAQAVAHRPVDVQALDCDFYVFSGHKMYGPDGIGVLYGKARHLEAMPPYQSGGDMVKWVTFEKTIYADIPSRFEAGTPAIAGAVGLGVAVDYLNRVGVEAIARRERKLMEYATRALSDVPRLRLIGTAREKSGVLSFVIDGIHPHDVGTILDREGVAIRTGHHCAQPVMAFFGVPATARASLALYNTYADIDALVRGLERVKEVFN